jgi:phosphatidylinositol alpha-mannosyltransferase
VDAENAERYGYGTIRIGRSVVVLSNGSISRGSAGPGLKARMARVLESADVVHAQALAAPTLALFALRTSAAPVTVGTFHTYFPPGVYDRIYRLFRTYVGNALDRLDRRIAVSQVALETFERLFPGGRWEVVPNGIDTDLYRPLRPGEAPPPGPARLLFVGRFDRRNALDVLLEAVGILVHRGHDLVLQVVGDGPSRALHQREARRLGISGRVEWHGMVNEERPRLYREATVFAAPCTLASFGVVLLEALASGVPVVWTDNVGFHQVMRDGMPGSPVPPRNAAALAGAIEALLADPARRSEWGTRGRNLVVERYAWPIVARQVERIYENVRAENGGGPRPPVRVWRRDRRRLTVPPTIAGPGDIAHANAATTDGDLEGPARSVPASLERGSRGPASGDP